MRALLAVLACGSLAHAAPQEPAAAAREQEPVAVRAPLQVVGRVAPVVRQIVRARTDGHVSRVQVKPGDVLEPLQPMITLSAPELLGRLGAADTRVRAAELGVQVLGIREERTRLLIAAAERRLRSARERHELQRKKTELQETAAGLVTTLHEAGKVSATELASSQRDLLLAQSALVDAAEAEAVASEELQLAKLAQSEAQAVVAEARARVGELRGELDSWQARIAALEIKNLVRGARVANVLVAPGQVVVAGETPLLEIYDDRRVRIVFEVRAADAGAVSAGNKVRIRSADGQLAVETAVAWIDPFAGDAGSVVAVCELDNAERKHVLGGIVHGEIDVTP